MKTLLITLLLSASLFAATTTVPNKTPSLMECEMVLAMFELSIEQGNPVTKEQIEGAIEPCSGQVKHQKIADTMERASRASKMII